MFPEPTELLFTNNQLADMLTKGNFTRDEWNHLLCVFDISHFSSTNCSEVISKRTQEDAGEERVTAKSKSMMNLVSRCSVRDPDVFAPTASQRLGKTRYESRIPLSSWNEQQPRTERPVMDAGSSRYSECVKTTSHKTVFGVWTYTRNSSTSQKLNEMVQRQIELTTRSAQWKFQQCVKWPETLGESASVVDFHAWAIMHWRSFVFVVSLFVVSLCRCPLIVFFVKMCAHCGSSRLKFESPFTPLSSMHWVSVVSDFDFSLHFISFLMLSLITLLFLLSDTIIFLNVVDQYPANFR